MHVLLIHYHSSESVLGICVRIMQYEMFLKVNLSCVSSQLASVIIIFANNI